MAKAVFSLSAAIQLVEPNNPKRGASAAIYDLYQTVTTVAEYLAAGGTRAGLAWDVERGYINVVGGYYPEESAKPTVKVKKVEKVAEAKAAAKVEKVTEAKTEKRAPVAKAPATAKPTKAKAGRRAVDPVVVSTPVKVKADDQPK